MIASEFVKIHLQEFINHGYVVSDPESGEPWKLEKAEIKLVVREKIKKFETLLKDKKSVSEN
jgi:hypothetical protein